MGSDSKTRILEKVEGQTECDKCEKEILTKDAYPHKTYEFGFEINVPYCEKCFVESINILE